MTFKAGGQIFCKGHLNQTATYFVKVISIGENFDSNAREEKSKWAHGIWPFKLKAFSERYAESLATSIVVQRFDRKNLKLSSSLSARMKFYVALLIMLAVTVAAVVTCTEKEWRGHVILCCKNGTALKSRSNNWIWVETMPLMCRITESEVTEKQMSGSSINAIIGATLLCIGCHLYYAIAYCFYRVVREMW